MVTTTATKQRRYSLSHAGFQCTPSNKLMKVDVMCVEDGFTAYA